MVSLDEGRFPALELNNRRLSAKNSFCRKNGVYTSPSNELPLRRGGGVHGYADGPPYNITPAPTPSGQEVSPPRPTPGCLHYSDEDVSTKYNDLRADSSSLTEKPSEMSDSQNTCLVSHTQQPCGFSVSPLWPCQSARRSKNPKNRTHHTVVKLNPSWGGKDFWKIFFLSYGSESEYEVEEDRRKTHSFVNHYISDPTYYNSWRRQQRGLSRPQAYGHAEADSGRPNCTPQATPQGTLLRSKSSRTPTPALLSPSSPSHHSAPYRPSSSTDPGSQAPIAGFSSFSLTIHKMKQLYN
ncbi:hypothetical protein JZ751_027539 [Albula glossodonta]|uniref:Uncharacterized protein n=1 Tax=Albula glossodonta TaxID=121402 RepID=A0A8T2NNC0_9TELE|nr:hypothetical protein JZ751_027539 [Albula glossodonta]